MVLRTFCFAAVLGATLGVPITAAQTSSEAGLTVEWIFGDDGRRVAALPSYTWLSDGTLMLYDGREPESQRIFEVLDPSANQRRVALDMAAAIGSLKLVFPQTDVKQALPWPLMFDPAGHRALYVFQGDLFLLHLPTAQFARLTNTDAEERSPGFSPDGQHVAFVRAGDLYVVDVSTLGKLFDVMIYPMRKHGIEDRDATIHLYRTMLQFWKRYL